MKKLLTIALAFVFVVSCAELASAQIRQPSPPTKTFTLSTGQTFTIKRLPLPQPPKPPLVLTTLPSWATTLAIPNASGLLQKPFSTSAPAKPFFVSPSLQPVFPASAKPINKISDVIKDRNKTINRLHRNQMINTVITGVNNMIGEKIKRKIMTKLSSGNTGFDQSQSESANINLNVPQYEPASKNVSPVVIITSNLDKPDKPQIQSSASSQAANSGLTVNSSLKIVHITADGTVILVDDRNNYYSLPSTNTRDNRAIIPQNVIKPPVKQNYSQRKRTRSRN